MTPEEIMRAVLLSFIKSEKRRAEAAEALDDALTEAGLLADEFETVRVLGSRFETVRVLGSRLGVERTYVGGLTVVFDAAGNAVEVSSMYGLEIAS